MKRFYKGRKRKVIKKIFGTVTLAWSLKFSSINRDTVLFINNKTISNYSSTEIYFYNLDEENAVNGNRVRLGSGEIIGRSKLNSSITSRTMEEAVLKLRAGDDRLIRSIISKASESEWDMPSINKLLQKLVELSLEIGSNNKLMRILAELEKPTIFVDGLIPQLPRHRKLTAIEKNKLCTPSSEFLVDSTKCYGHREGYNMPRSVSEKFETKAVRKLAETSLKNPKLKKEYGNVMGLLEEGVHPINIGKKSTYVGSTKVLVKKTEGRYIVDISDTHADIIGLSSRTNDKCMEKFEILMNKLYDLDLKGY